MLRDIKDSERINREVQTKSQSQDIKRLYVKVISTGYWKEYKDQDEPVDIGVKERAKYGEGHVPQPEIRSNFNEFSTQFNKYKSLRDVIFRQNLGNVELTLTFANGQFKFNASPI